MVGGEARRQPEAAAVSEHTGTRVPDQVSTWSRARERVCTTKVARVEEA